VKEMTKFESTPVKDWGAHAPRVLISAPSPKCSGENKRGEKKFAMTRASSPAREGACAPRNDDFAER